jgi:hypothetical protein
MNHIYISNILSYSILFRGEKHFYSKMPDTKILIAGDSHPRADVFHGIIDNSYIFANSAESIIQTYYHLYYLLEKEKMEIELVILPIDLHSFSSFRSDRFENTGYYKKYINYFELGIIKEDLLRYLNIRLLGEFLYIGGIGNTENVLLVKTGAKQLERIYDGHYAGNDDYALSTNKKYDAEIRATRHLKGFDVIDDDMVYFFFRTIDLLISNDVKIVLVRYPITTQYFSEAGEFMDIDSYYKKISILMKEKDYDIPLLDYHDLFWDNMHLFNDADHLNNKGAKIFTYILEDDLINLGMYPIE